MRSFLQDLRYSLRQLINHPGFALTAILSLALGIAATVSVFSVIYGVLLHPFPYRDVDRLANLSIRIEHGEITDAYFTGLQLQQLRKVHGFEGIASWNPALMVVTEGPVPESVNGMTGIGSTFPMLGTSPLLGRNLGPSDAPDGQEPQPVVELNYRFWQRHFNGDPAVIGRTLELDHKQYTIIGVTRPNFTWGWGTDIYLPQAITNPRGGGVVVKLRRGVSLAAANAELQPLLDRFAQQDPRGFPQHFKVEMHSLTWETNHNMGGTLYLLFAAVTTLLLIGCGNVSILLLARGTARQHEFAVRSAVGAGSSRIVRQLLTESLLLALTGTALGIALAYRLLALIVSWLPRHLFPPDVSMRINVPVLLFSAGLALITSILFGLVPALHVARPEIIRLMQSNTPRAAGSLRGWRLHSTLIAGQIALTLLLLTAAGIAIDSFVRLLRVPLGYVPRNVLSVGIPVHQHTYTDWQARVNYFEQLRTSIGTLPDVLSVAISPNSTPPDSGWEEIFQLLGQPAASPATQTTRFNLVGQDYFRTLQIPLLQGRTWTPAEVAHGAPLVLVNQTFVRQYFANGDIIGHSLIFPGLRNHPPETTLAPGGGGWMQVIGTVSDSVNNGIEMPVRPAVYLPYSTQVGMSTQLLVRTRIAPELVVKSLRERIAAVNPAQETYAEITSLEKWIQDEPVWERGRLISALFGGFSLLALLLSAVGLYSVVSYTVAQRTNEFGIRMALGAPRRHVFGVVLTSVRISVATGIAAGLILSVAMQRVLAGWIGGTAHHSMIALIGSLLLILVSLIACLVPARRAVSVDPVVALRCE